MIEFYLPYPPSINNYYVRTKYGTMIGKAGKAYRERIIESVQEQLGPLDPLAGQLNLTIVLFPPDNRWRDIDNTQKALLDAITHSGVWADDRQVDQLFVYRGERVVGGKIYVQINDAGPIIKQGQESEL